MKTLKLTAAVTGLLFAGLTTSNAHAQNLGQFFSGSTPYHNGVSNNGYSTICGPSGCTAVPNGNYGGAPQAYQPWNGSGPAWNAVGQNWQYNSSALQYHTQQGTRSRQDAPQYGPSIPQHNQGYYGNNFNHNSNNHHLQPQFPVQQDPRFNSQPVRNVPTTTPGLINWNRPLFGSGLF